MRERDVKAKLTHPLPLDTVECAESDHRFVTTSGTPLSEDGTEEFVPNGIVFDGRFRIEERVAEGGFAVVYKAVQVALDRRVALKVLKMLRLPDERARVAFCDRFADEAKTIALIRHPHIVDVYDFSVSTTPGGDLTPWMALEWLDGESLAQFLYGHREAGGTGLPPREAVDFLRPAVEAIAYAHSRGIVHRDIKPGNIMVATTPKGTSIRVLDFGIAKIMSDDRLPVSGDTRTEGIPAFSPAYAAPEQVNYSRTGPWTDVHALGLVLTELMTGQAAFAPRHPDEHMFEQVMAAVRPTPASRGRDVGDWEPIIAKAVAISPRDRWRNAGQLLEALDKVTRDGSSGVAIRAPGRRQARTLALAGVGAALGIAVMLEAGPLMRARTPPPSQVPTETLHQPPSTGSEAASTVTQGRPGSPELPSAAPPPTTSEAAPRASHPAPALPAAKPVRHPAARRHGAPEHAAPVNDVRRGTPPKDPRPPLNDGIDLFNDTK
jgi:eukaryotic-like serine/threonine-protein kinase